MIMVEAMSQNRFNELCYLNNWNDMTSSQLYNTAFISIIGTKDVLTYYLGEEDTEHWFKHENDNVLNLEFDDVDSDIEFDGYKAYAFTDEQAKRTVDFIEKNLGKRIVVHCRAGFSRSVAIVRFILEHYSDIYKWSECVTDEHNYNHPNVDVLSKLNKIMWERKFNNHKE